MVAAAQQPQQGGPMDPVSLAAIAVAVIAVVVAALRVASLNKELAAVRAKLDDATAELARSQKSIRALEAAPKPEPVEAEAREVEPAAPLVEEPAEPEPAADEPPEESPDLPEVDAAVIKRAKEMLRDARLMARHVGFDSEVNVNGQTGTRVIVQLETDVDQEAFAYLRDHSADVLDAGTRNGDIYLVVS